MALTIQDKSRLIYLSTAINREAKTDKNYTFVFNPFFYDGSAEMRELLTDTLTDCLCELLSDASLTYQMQRVIKPCIDAVLRIKDPAQRNLATLARFFVEGDNLDLVRLGLESDSEQHQKFFQNWYAEHLKVSKNSLNVKLSFFLTDKKLTSILNGVPTIDYEKAINEDGAVILLNITKGSGGFTSRIIGKLMFAYLHALMMRRDALEEHERKNLYVLADEAASVLTASTGASLAEARKYKMICCLSLQSLSQVTDKALRDTITVNTGLKIAGQTSYADRVFFSRELGISQKEMENLHPLEFYMKRPSGRSKVMKFKAMILPRFYFISKKQKQQLLQWIVKESGQYQIVAPPPPPPPPEIQLPKSLTKKQPKPPSDGLKPAF
jgi:hypothetical protein